MSIFTPPLYIATAEGETITIPTCGKRKVTMGAVRDSLVKMRDKLGVDVSEVLAQLDRAAKSQAGQVVHVNQDAVTMKIDAGDVVPEYFELKIETVEEAQRLIDRALWIDLRHAPETACFVKNCNTCAQNDIDRQARVALAGRAAAK